MPGPRSSSHPIPGLSDYVRRIGAARNLDERSAVFADLARAAEQADASEYLLHRFLNRDANGQRFALEVAANLNVPLPATLIDDLVELVEQSRFPSRLRLAAASRIIRSIPESSPLIPRLIESFRTRVSPRRVVRRLRRLAALLPDQQQVRDALAEAEAGPSAPCPRCEARLGADEMVRHLWEKHRLLMENGRVREPWDLIGQWLGEYARSNRSEFLDRSCDLAQALDPANGLSRVHRLLLIGGSDDDEARALLRAEALEQNASLCPNCFALAPLPIQASPTPVVVGSGRVDGGGYRVDLSDRYLYTRLLVETPTNKLFVGPDPGRALTRRGAILLFLIPIVALACVFAVLPKLLGIAPVIPVGGLLLAAAVIYVGIAVSWPKTGDLSNRAVDHAWTLMVPRMIQYELRRPGAAFLAGLAEASRGRGDTEAREEPLQKAIAALRKERGGIPYISPLSVLQITDDMKRGGDDLPAIANEVGESFDGALPLDHADRLLRELRGDPKDRTRRARLRVLILARAFAAGLEAEDLRIIGQVCPVLGSSYASEDRDGVARLKLLWLYRPHRLWQRIGSATTVFDLARYPRLAENYLRQRPDLLLFQASGGSEETAPILVCEEGVVFRDLVITDPRTPIKVRARSLVRGGGFELAIEERVFRFREDPTLLARRLKGWAEFLFNEFLPRARMLARRRSEIGDRLLMQKATTCPECKRTFAGLVGEIGLTAIAPAIGDVT
jgi:hypothetical protein